MRKLLPSKPIQITARFDSAESEESREMGTSVSDQLVFQNIRPQCPRCRANIGGLGCRFCGLPMRANNEIVCCLSPDRASHYAHFIEDYARIRAEEGRGSSTDDFYLCLPYKDLSGRNNKQWKIRARSFEHLMKHVLKKNLALEGARIMDLGAGNCWLSYRLALARCRPVAVDLITNDHDGLGAAEHFRKHLSTMFPRFQAELTRLPFQDQQFDAAVFNASFHYSENYAETLREALRCVRSGGMVIISDTPWYSSEESGRKMVAERDAAFLARYGTASDHIRSLEFLTDDRLRALEEQLHIQWTIYSARYGLRWAMRPLVAKLCNRREPSRFRIYVAQKP